MDVRKNILPIVLAVALVGTGWWGYNQKKTRDQFETKLTNNYQRMFYDMKDNIETVQTSLSKSLLSESQNSNILLLTQIWQQAYFAHDNLAQLPIRHSNLAKTEKFLNQVADYSYSLIRDHLAGKEMTDKQRQQLFKLQDYTKELSKELQDAHEKLRKGNIDLAKVTKKQNEDIDKANQDLLDTQMAKYEEDQLTEYPELIYDGPFSDQILDVKPKGLGTKKVSEEEARTIAKKFIGEKKVGKITAFESGENFEAANIPSYTFSITPENKEKEDAIYIGISRVGGKVVWMENPRQVPNPKLKEKEALKYAQTFLKEKGYKNLEPNYSQHYEDSITFNFAYTQEDVTIYTDLVKVKVALDDGEITGFDASKYLKSHHERDIPEPKLTQADARDKVRYDFDVKEVRLAIIPDQGNNDLLCYEFSGVYKGADFIVYINALTGKEEQILQIIQDEDGTLMM